MHDVQLIFNDNYRNTSRYYLLVHLGTPNALLERGIINFG